MTKARRRAVAGATKAPSALPQIPWSGVLGFAAVLTTATFLAYSPAWHGEIILGR